MKRVISFIMAAVLLIAMFPAVSAPASAAEIATDAVIYAKKAYTKPGYPVTVDLYVKNNPGILGMTLKVNYDESKATLVSVENGDAMPHMTFTTPKNLKSGCRLPWDAEDVTAEDIMDGKIVSLTFNVSDSAPINEPLSIDIVYDSGAIIDANMNPIAVQVEPSSILVLDYFPGDTNSSNIVDTTDVVFLRRHIAGGYNVTINTSAGDVNDDGMQNTTDVVYIRRYIAGGYGVELLPSTPKCPHTMEYIPFKAATCEEDGNISYSHCTTCGKYYTGTGNTEITLASTVMSKTGHTAVTDPYVAPTPESVGWTEGSHCGTCGKILVPQVEIPIPKPDEYYIVYHISESDLYLQSLERQDKIENPNPSTYFEGDTVSLLNLSVPGYVFEGWYDGAGQTAEQVKKIENQVGAVHLYAHWSKLQYTVQFDAPIVPMAAETYSVDTGLTLKDPDLLPGYLFMGWTDSRGKLVDQIPVGSVGNITLYGNWTSSRNQTRPNTNMGNPIIHFDEENDQILFAYEIGTVENIPLYELEYIGNVAVPGTNIERTITKGITIDQSSAQEISEAISNATTKSSEWTLSSEWTESSSISESHLHEMDSSLTTDTSAAYSSSGTFNIGTSRGGSHTTAVESGVSAKVGTSASMEASVGFPIDVVDVGAKVSAEVSAEVSEETKVSSSDTKTWNTDVGYSASQEASYETSVSQSLAEKISNSVTYDVSKAATEGKSNTESTAETSEETREYASSFTYGTAQFEEQTYTVAMNNAPVGYYRMVAAGKAHAFGVVVYDIATRSYGTYTYSIMEDTVRPFLDYSKESDSFDDNENGVLPFTVPYFVNNYVDSIVGASDGLVVDVDTGMIVGYTGDDAVVVVPQYIPVDDGDGTPTVVKITGFTANAFAGKDFIKAVQLCKNITAIPDNAFKDCTSLVIVTGSAVTSIGANAFSGCTALKDYEVSSSITSMGANAFTGVNKLSVNAANAAMVDAAIASGAKNISVNMKNLSGGLSEKTYTIPASTEYFAFIGNGDAYQNVQINSKANTTEINNMTLLHSSDTALVISSENVVLNRLTLESPGIALKLTAENANVGLYGTVNVNSASAHAALCKNANFFWSNSGVTGKVIFGGNLLSSGDTIQGESNLSYTKGTLIHIDTDNPVIVTFDPNGGAVSETSRMVYGGTSIGDLPVPTRDYYTFRGWYTSAEGGEQVTADMLMATDMTAYARWEHNPVSSWVLASNLPEGAEVLDQKWTYTQKYTTESRETSLAGYNQTGSYWVKSGSGSQNYASFPGGFSTGHWIYQNFAKSVPFAASETATAKREVSNNWAGYVYWHWGYNVAYAKNMGRMIGDRHSEGSSISFVYFYALTSGVNCPVASAGYVNGYSASNAPTTYDCRDILPASTSTTDGMTTPRFLRFDYYTSTYTDYYKMFQYEKYENKESATEIAASGTISNVQKWVQYRAK